MLTKKKKAYFKKLLTRKLEALLAERPVPSGEDSVPVKEGLDFADQATHEAEMDLSFHMKQRHGNMVAKLQEALERLEEGTYETQGQARGRTLYRMQEGPGGR
ncbi:MAG: hypothetical protein JRF59_04125 [Deltaproteobacteria bacterium]|nr:hypothetical protein [Deltaproteobacteria bacterium]